MKKKGVLRKFKTAVTCFMAVIMLATMIFLPACSVQQKSSNVAGTDIDWSVKLCDSFLAKTTPAMLNRWIYPTGLLLEGVWRVYKRTNNEKYFNFIKEWVDMYVDDNGFKNVKLDSLDNMMPGLLLCHLYEKTGENKYKVAAQQIRNRLVTYPRTSDGAFVHNVSVADQLWLDGAFMLTVFLINYGKTFQDSEYCNNECAKQLILYNKHLEDPATQLAWHAWDEDGSEKWANPSTHNSPEFWCRAIGWYVVACVEVLEVLPPNHPDREKVEEILRNRLEGLKKYQDSTTGLWYQMVNRGGEPDNWVEQSSACMYTYAMSKAMERGYINKNEFYDTAKRGYEGILSNIELDSSGNTVLYGTCQGTNVGDRAYYAKREQSINDNHGQGAFLISNEQQRTKYTNLRKTFQAEKGTINRGTIVSTNRGFTGAGSVRLMSEAGSYVELKVNVPEAGKKTLIIRYSNGNANSKPLKVTVNGSMLNESLLFETTGASTVWSSKSIKASLSAGENTVRLESVASDGALNIDWIAIE